MKSITLICFGKLKTPGLSEAVAEFAKRLTRYTQFEVHELKPQRVPEKSETLRAEIQAKESDQVQEVITKLQNKNTLSKSCAIWCLDETGKALKTTEWAKAFKGIQDQHQGELVLVVGGSLGISPSLRESGHRTISLGPQTLSHELARLILTEQIYRVLSYIEGHPYHNEG